MIQEEEKKEPEKQDTLIKEEEHIKIPETGKKIRRKRYIEKLKKDPERYKKHLEKVREYKAKKKEDKQWYEEKKAKWQEKYQEKKEDKQWYEEKKAKWQEKYQEEKKDKERYEKRLEKKRDWYNEKQQDKEWYKKYLEKKRDSYNEKQQDKEWYEKHLEKMRKSYQEKKDAKNKESMVPSNILPPTGSNQFANNLALKALPSLQKELYDQAAAYIKKNGSKVIILPSMSCNSMHNENTKQ